MSLGLLMVTTGLCILIGIFVIGTLIYTISKYTWVGGLVLLSVYLVIFSIFFTGVTLW